MKPRIPDETIRSEKQFVHWSDELTDTEAQNAFRIIAEVGEKYKYKTATVDNLEALRDEVLTRLAEINILAEIDPAPCLYGEPPIVEIKGKLAMDGIHKYGFDHEQKKWEIDKAHGRGEDYLGEKESTTTRRAAKNGDSTTGA